jgi:hypothetical protein
VYQRPAPDGGLIDSSVMTIRGFTAFGMAIIAALDNFRNYGTGHSLLAILSVLTSVLFVLGSPWVVLRGTRRLRRFSAWAAADAFVLKAHWYGWEMGLGIGYFFWWSSFAVLAAGLFDRTRRKAETTPTQTALLQR